MQRYVLLSPFLCVCMAIASCIGFRDQKKAAVPDSGQCPVPCVDARNLADTVVTPTLEQNIEEGKNVLWCGTFQLAWNELAALSGAEVRMKAQSAVADILNKKAFSADDLDAESFVVAAGFVGDGVLKKIQAQIDLRFKGQASPILLRRAEALPPGAVVTYAYLGKQLPFKWAFEQLPAMEFGAARHEGVAKDEKTAGKRVNAFGIDQYLPNDPALLKEASQVKVLWHRFEEFDEEKYSYKQEFIVEFETASAKDRLILAKINPEKTLGRTIERVLGLAASPNTRIQENPQDLSLADPEAIPKEERSKYACLLPLEKLEIPVLEFDLWQEFSELCGSPIVSKNPRLNGQALVLAEQRVRFRLDRTGAVLESEGWGAGGGPLREFSFREPFLILLIRKGSSRPYLVLWVANAELMSPPEESAKP